VHPRRKAPEILPMAPFLLITDLDNTLVGDDVAMAELNQRLSQHRQQYGTKIVYSTGRSPMLYRELAEAKSLLEPDAVILAVGTEIYFKSEEQSSVDFAAHLDQAWVGLLSQAWDRAAVTATTAHFADLIPQPASEQRPFKASYFLTEQVSINLLPQLEAALKEQHLDVQLIYSGSKDLDILPSCADKGKAMSFLRQQLGIPALQTVACGDSGNDLSMFADRPERGIIVGNAMPELLSWHRTHPNGGRYFAKNHCAGGILEGLQHFGFL
jgi:sucrose-6-phosphatase